MYCYRPLKNLYKFMVRPQFLSVCPCRRPAITLYRNKTEDQNETKILGDMKSKYQVFDDKDAEVVLDVYEERLKYSNLEEQDEEIDDRYDGLNLERGVNGVFDIEDLVEVLKREKAHNLFVAKVPKEINYVDYICVVSGHSQRHMQAIIQFVRRVYKYKRGNDDILPKIEGENSKDWIAIDLGNIALHVFSEKARTTYDLESLWTVGPQYDNEFNKVEIVSEVLDKHSVYLSGLKPAS